jgi:6-phosphogluconolactonase
MDMQPEVRRFPDLEQMNRDAAAFVCDWARRCVDERGRFTIALSGGTTPRRLYERMARPPYDVRIPWSHVHLFWGDERCVPPTHPDSNYLMAYRALISKVAPPADHVHRPPAELTPPERAAQQWEKDLRDFFQNRIVDETLPSFDLILLGMGPDGHVASLFPGDPALEETERWVTAVTDPRGEPAVPRLTLTLPLINHARCVLFLVSGNGKREAVRAVLGDGEQVRVRYPAARVRPNSRLLWFLDGTSV